MNRWSIKFLVHFHDFSKFFFFTEKLNTFSRLKNFCVLFTELHALWLIVRSQGSYFIAEIKRLNEFELFYVFFVSSYRQKIRLKCFDIFVIVPPEHWTSRFSKLQIRFKSLKYDWLMHQLLIISELKKTQKKSLFVWKESP